MPPAEDELYQQRILDHYEEPFHRGRCPQATHAHEDENPLCGDVVRVELLVDSRRHDSRRLLRRRRLLHQPGLGLDAGGADLRPAASTTSRRFGRRHARAVRNAADAQPPKVLPAAVAGLAVGDLLAARRYAWRQPQRRSEMATHGKPPTRSWTSRTASRRFSDPGHRAARARRSARACRWCISTTPPRPSIRGR